MNRSLRSACVFLATSLTALPLIGCKVTLDPLTRYEGAPQNESIPYTAGHAVHIISAHGQIEVVKGGSDQVEVTFSPFTMDEDGAEDRAIAEMQDDLTMTTSGTDTMTIEVATKDDASSYLGADIRVALPSTFDGDFEIDQDNGAVAADLSGGLPRSTDIVSANGSIQMSGARGKLNIVGSEGNVDVGVAAWAIDNGVVQAGSGNITFTLPGNLNGTLNATAGKPDGQVTESGLPESWALTEEEGAKSYTMGDGSGAHVELKTDLGDISIVVK